MGFAAQYRKGEPSAGPSRPSSLGAQYRKTSQGISPKVRTAPVRPRGEANPNYKRAVEEASKFKAEADRVGSKVGIAKETGRGVVKALAEYIPKTAVSLAETPGTLVRGTAKQKTYNLPVIGDFKSYQSDAEDTAGDIIEGKKPLYTALKPFVELPLNFLPLGLKKPGGQSTIASAYSNGQRTRRLAGGQEIARTPKTIPQGQRTAPQPRIDTPTPPRDLSDVASYPETIPEKLSTSRKFITSGDTILKKSGPAGEEMSGILRKQLLDEDLTRGEYVSRLKEATNGLRKEELENLTDVLEGKANPLNNRVIQSFPKVRELYDEVAKKAQGMDFEVRVPGGKSVPFTPRENYAPRIYNFDDLTKANRREELLQHLVDTKQARNKAEASKLFDDFISANGERRSGNLENARMLDLPGYEKNAAKAGESYLSTAAQRFSEAENFGKKDEKIADLIGKISDSGGDYMEAQRVFDYLSKGVPKNKAVSALTQFNLATKLDLGAITNITQSVNTIVKGGVKNFLKAVVSGKEGRRLSELAGVYDDMVILKETGVNPARLVRFVMAPFGKVERMNRFLASNTGRFRVQDLMKVAKTNPEAKYAIRQLKTLGIDINKVDKLTERDILVAMNKMSEMTQFKPNVLNIPPSWKTPMGRLAMQFKSFSFMQTRFVTDEILKEAKQGNIAPLMRFIVTVPIFSYASYQAKKMLKDPMDKNDYEDKRNLDLRDFDKYVGAGKSFYSEPVTQGDFLKDTYDSDFNSPIKKIFRTAGTFLGPTMGEVGSTIDSLEQVAKKRETNRMWYDEHEQAQEDPYFNLKRQAVGMIPFVGEGLKNTYFDFNQETEAQKAKAKAIEAIQKEDWNLLQSAQAQDPYLRKQKVFSNLFKEAGKGKMSEKDKQTYRDFFDKTESKKSKPFY